MKVIIELSEDDFMWSEHYRVCCCSYNRLIQIVSEGTPLEEQEPCTDAISREAVKNIIRGGVCTDTEADIEYVCGLIDDLPSVATSEKVGRWIPVEYPTGVEAFGVKEMTAVALKCSECGEEVDISDGDFKLCPYCGAKMASPTGAEGSEE